MDAVLHSHLPDGPAGGRPLLFVHGAWHGAWCWEDYVLPWFAARGHPAHAVDLRGHGEAPSDRPLRRTRIHHYAADLAAAVEQIGGAPVLVGHSMGAFVVARYLEDHDVPGAVLVAPVPARGALGPTLRVARRHPVAFLRANLTMRLRPVVGTPILAREYLFGDDVPPTEFTRHFARLQDASYAAYLDMVFHRARPERSSSPVLVVAAGFDRLFTAAEMRRTAAAYRADLVTIAGAPHDLMIDARWMEMARAVEDWVRRLPG
jgi:pimeloyl-ACP methyl ester carboxylesterase